MPLNQEVARSIFAAWRIARFDAGAMNYFNLTLEGFWRSFFAAGLSSRRKRRFEADSFFIIDLQRLGS